MEALKLEDLKLFVQQCKANPSILHNPSLDFFRTYLEGLGANLPSPQVSVKVKKEHVDEEIVDSDIELDNSDVVKPDNDPPQKVKKEHVDEEIVESDIELDNSDVVKPDNDPPQKMGDPTIEVTQEDQDAAQQSKSKAMEAISEGNLKEAIDLLTEAILLNPHSAILYATRASVFVKLNKPNAAKRDANAAIQINPDSAKGYKVRGIARAMLGFWEEAASDLHVASKLDHDEEIDAMLRKVEANVHKIQEHRRKYERLYGEKLQKELKQKEHEKQRAQQDHVADLKDGHVIGIHSTQELEKKLNAASGASRLAVMYFTATWCGPCRHISPVYTSLASKYPKVVFLKVDIDEASDVAQRWHVSSVPTFFFIKDGKEVDKVVGADKSSLERKIVKYASKLQ